MWEVCGEHNSHNTQLRGCPYCKAEALTAEVDRLKAELKTARADTFREAAKMIHISINHYAMSADTRAALNNMARKYHELADRAERGEG